MSLVRSTGVCCCGGHWLPAWLIFCAHRCGVGRRLEEPLCGGDGPEVHRGPVAAGEDVQDGAWESASHLGSVADCMWGKESGPSAHRASI